MRNSRALLLVVLSSVSTALLPHVMGISQDPGFVVRDASGRVRITSFEGNGAFGLKLLDEGGGDSVVLRCWGRGEGAIDMYGASGRVAVSLGRQPGDEGCRITLAAGEKGHVVSMTARDDGQCMLSMDGADKGHLICGLDAGGASSVIMAQGRGDSEQSIVLRNGGGGRSGGSAPGGLTLSRAGSRVGGFLVDKNSGMAWIGGDALVANEKWRGVRFGWGLEKGAFMELRQTDNSYGVRIQDFAKEGSGVEVGKAGGDVVRVGIGAGGPNIQLATERGLLLRLPD